MPDVVRLPPSGRGPRRDKHDSQRSTRRPPPPFVGRPDRDYDDEDMSYAPPRPRRRRRSNGGCGMSMGVLVLLLGLIIFMGAIGLALILREDLRDAIGMGGGTATTVAVPTAAVVVTPTAEPSLAIPTAAPPPPPTPVPPTATPAPPTLTPFPTPDPVVVEAMEVARSVGISWPQDAFVNVDMKKEAGAGFTTYIIWGAMDRGQLIPGQNLYDLKNNPQTKLTRKVYAFVQDVPDNQGCISTVNPSYKFEFSNDPVKAQAERAELERIASEGKRLYDGVIAQTGLPLERQPLADNGPSMCAQVDPARGAIFGNVIFVIIEQNLEVPTATPVIRVP